MGTTMATTTNGYHGYNYNHPPMTRPQTSTPTSTADMKVSLLDIARRPAKQKGNVISPYESYDYNYST